LTSLPECQFNASYSFGGFGGCGFPTRYDLSARGRPGATDALYFFHIRDGWNVVPDEEGMELPDLNIAMFEGYASAADLASAALSDGHNLAAYAVEIADESGTVLRRTKAEPVYRVAS
jgi:hypothetical protein